MQQNKFFGTSSPAFGAVLGSSELSLSLSLFLLHAMVNCEYFDGSPCHSFANSAFDVDHYLYSTN